MRENIRREKIGIEQNSSERFDNLENKRLNLNDLLDRAKLQKKKEMRNNTLIISGVGAGIAVVYLLLVVIY